jgi:hypothetical protein
MQNYKLSQHLIVSILAICILASPLFGQVRNTQPKRPPAAEFSEPAPTFDSLLASESYKVYCEIRGVGGLIRSSAVNDLLDPLLKLGGPPKEFKTVIKWLNAHSDALAGSRMMVAGWPSRPELPTVLIAIEFSSPEEAKKFYPELRDFLPKILPTPTPNPSPTPAPQPAARPSTSGPANRIGARSVAVQAPAVATTPQEVAPAVGQMPTGPAYQMKQVGSLVLLSDQAVVLRKLRPRGSKSLEEDQNFLQARSRFASESLFLYVDLKSIEKEEKDRRQKWEDEAQKRAEAEAASHTEAVPEPDVTALPVEPQAPPAPSETPDASAPTVRAMPIEPQNADEATLSGAARGTDEMAPPFFSLYSALFSGEAKWPEAIGAALVFEGDAYVVRTLIVNTFENKTNAVPFLPQFVPGPAIVPEAANIFPADMDLFVSVSLDYPQIYDGMLKSITNEEERAKKYSRGPLRYPTPSQSPFAYYEKKLGLKIKDDVLPLLGTEFAFALSKKSTKPSNETSPKTPDNSPAVAESNQSNSNAGQVPVIAIAVKDRETVSRLIPKIIEGFGLKGAKLLAQTEKREGTEIVSYAGAFSYAFVGDFLVVSPDPAETQHVVDAYLNHQTLSSDSHFRNFTRWQPRQVLGQVYVAPGLVEQYTVGGYGGRLNEKMADFLARVNPIIDPLTYSLSNDGGGPLHELHVPRNLLQLIVAGASSETNQTPLLANEAMARTALYSIMGSEARFKAGKGAGSYGTLDQLLSENLIDKDLIENHGYRIDVMVSGNKFEATAVPVEHGKTGRLSFFIDNNSGVMRAGDHGGGVATVADEPLK